MPKVILSVVLMGDHAIDHNSLLIVRNSLGNASGVKAQECAGNNRAVADPVLAASNGVAFWAMKRIEDRESGLLEL